MKDIQLLGDRIMIQPEEAQDSAPSVSEGGFVLPEDTKETNVKQGRVHSVGTGARNEQGERMSLEINSGDVVLYEYANYRTKTIEVDGVEYDVIAESDIIGIITK